LKVAGQFSLVFLWCNALIKAKKKPVFWNVKYLAVFATVCSFKFQSPDEKSHAHCIERYVKKEQEKLLKIVFLIFY